MNSQATMFPIQPSLIKPAIGAIGFLLALFLPNSPFWADLWIWFGTNKDILQGFYYAAMTVGFFWRGSIWAIRWRRRKRQELEYERRARIYSRLNEK